jgi:hypothetical protein
VVPLGRGYLFGEQAGEDFVGEQEVLIVRAHPPDVAFSNSGGWALIAGL